MILFILSIIGIVSSFFCGRISCQMDIINLNLGADIAVKYPMFSSFEDSFYIDLSITCSSVLMLVSLSLALFLRKQYLKV